MTVALSVTFAFLLCCSAVSLAADFEAPLAAFQTTPRPADGETVSANPPCFVYPADRTYESQGSHESYEIEVSTGPAFTEGTTKQLASPYLLLAPAEPLKPGAYFWRWRPSGAAEWSAVRAFTVSAEAPVVPFPDMDGLVKRLGASHPRVAVTAAGLADARQRALARFGDSWLGGVRKYAEQMRDKELLPEPEFLPETRDQRRIELYQKTFQTTRPFMRELANLAENYLLTSDELTGQEAKRRLLHVVSWDPKGSTSLGHNDEPATEVVRYCPTAFDRVYSLLTAEERRNCVDCLLTRMTEIRDRWRQRPFELNPYESHNMGYYLPDMVEACLAMVGDAPVEEMLRYTLLQLWSPFFPPYGGADGGWCEGPSYWGWSTSVFARTYQLVAQATGVPVHLRSNVRNMWRYKLYGNPPYFKMSPFGDGQESPAGGGGTMALLAALYDNPHAKWYADWQNAKLSGTDALLNAEPVDAKPPYDLPQGQAFYDVGLACMHTVLSDPADNVAVLMRSSPFGSISHAFADQNAFVLDAYGEPLIIASGYYQLYGCPHHAEWTWETKASNSVLVNGEGQSKRDWDAKGRLATFQTTAAGDYAVGDATQSYRGRLDRFQRHLLFLRPVHTGGAPLVVIHDDLSAPEPATYQFLLHALNEMQVVAAAQRVTVAKGDSRCRVEYLAPADLKFSQNDQFTKPPFRPVPNQWHLTASTVEPARDASSLIAIQPYRNGEADVLLSPSQQAGEGCLGLTLTGSDRVVTLLFRTDAIRKTVTLGDLTTNAQAATVCLVAGKVRSAAMFGGTSLTRGGKELLASDQTAAASASCCGGADRLLLSSDAAPGARLAAELTRPEKWSQGAGPYVKTKGDAGGATLPPLALSEGRQVPFETQRYDWVQRLVAQAAVPGPVGHCAVRLTGANSGDGKLPVALIAGAASVRRVLARGAQDVDLTLPAVSLGGDTKLLVTADEAFGGHLRVRRAAAERVYGVNLLPNESLSDAPDGVPAGWRAATISQNAQAEIASADGGRNGGKCLKVTCTDATGGDFGTVLAWPGIPPSGADRTFRMSCWVKTDATSVAGLQVTSQDWGWWKNTDRLRDAKEWTETALEFTLPAGENLTNVRLHMNAQKTGAALFVDDVRLVEVAPR